MTMRRIFALTVISVARVMATSSALTCPTGQMPNPLNGADTCCTCEVGFAQPDCMKCKPGYLFDNSSGKAVCRNGITDCGDALPYPHGCSGQGKCDKDNNGYYSCKCDNGYTGLGCQIAPAPGGAAGGGSSCHPAGVNLVTQSPLEVTYGEPFNLLMWGCELKDGDSYRIIPESGDCADPVSSDCQVTAAGLKSGAEQVGQACTSVEVTGSMTQNGGDQGAIEGLKLTAEDQGNMYKTCRKADGATDFSPVSTHDERGYRNPTFIAVPAAQANAYSAAALYEAQSAEDWKCCDDLEIRIGDICLPLWVWLLIMLLILAAIAYLLYKNHQLGKEIEMERNNRQFVADVGDDSALKLDAAKRAGADDDV